MTTSAPWRWTFAARLICGATMLSVVCGCQRSGNQHPTVHLEGRVTVDDKPLADGRIQFFPLGSSLSGTAAGQPTEAPITDGHYAADKVPVGKVRAVFAAIKETGKMINEAGHVFPERVSLIPDAYQSGVEIDVKEDSTSQDFLLKSAPATAPAGK